MAHIEQLWIQLEGKFKVSTYCYLISTFMLLFWHRYYVTLAFFNIPNRLIPSTLLVTGQVIEALIDW